MREPGLQQAIDAAGGVSELARKIGIAQPSVSNWSRVPAERVAAVEHATGVDRALLRPDLFSKAGEAAGMRVMGLAGWSGAGKTTLLTHLIPALTARGLAISTVKHAHHSFDIDQPGKDSHRHRMAGATEVVVGSANRWAVVHELRGAAEPTLHDLLARLSPVDIVIIEGYKREPHPKLEIYRAEVGKPLLQPEDPHIVAIASDAPLPAAVPVVPLDDIAAVAEIVLRHAAPLRGKEGR